MGRRFGQGRSLKEINRAVAYGGLMEGLLDVNAALWVIPGAECRDGAAR